MNTIIAFTDLYRESTSWWNSHTRKQIKISCCHYYINNIIIGVIYYKKKMTDNFLKRRDNFDI